MNLSDAAVPTLTKSQIAVQEKVLRRIRATNILIVCGAFLLSLGLLEIVVRAGGKTDADGQFSFAGYPLEPYVLPLEKLRKPIEEYLHLKDIATIIYDETLGWTYRPNSTRHEGTFTVNSAGLRARRDFSVMPAPDRLRIALFGDSFTVSDDVNDDEAWAYQLELGLTRAGYRAEVLNFGVGAYGMGQAYLRWQHEGRKYAPDIVIFGLQPDNLKRNLNVFRQLIHPSGPPFSKPRFILVDQKLELINSPTLPPEGLIATFEAFANHHLARYEYFYQSRYVASKWWSASRLAGLMFSILDHDEVSAGHYEQDSEGGQLGKAIVDAFAQDVLESDTAFIVLHLPLQTHLSWRFNSVSPPFQFLLEHARETYHYIPFEEHLHPFHVDDAYWGETSHYGAAINALLAEVVANDLLSCIETGSCPLARFDDLSTIRIAGLARES